MALSHTRCRSPTLQRLPLDSSMAITRYNGRGRIGPSFRGKLYEYESNGRRIIASWPKPRGKPVSEKQALSQKAFKEVAEAVKRTAAEIQNFHRLAAAGTPMLPRDTLFAALYGNGPTIKLYDGRIIKPMANKYLSSTVLDAIGWQEGTILYRGAETWAALTPGTPGQVLAIDEAGNPYWSSSAGGGGAGGNIFMPTVSTLSTGSTNLKGNWFIAWGNVSIDKLYVAHEVTAGDKLDLYLVFMSALNVVTSVPRVEVAVITGVGSLQYSTIDLAVPLLVPSGQKFAVMFSTNGKANNYPTRLRAGNAVSPQVPVRSNIGYCNIVKTVPAIGDALNVNDGAPYGFGLRMS